MYQWHEAVDALRPRMIRIATPIGTGSGFLLPWQSKSGLCAIATAAHVIDYAFYWEQPIRLDQALNHLTRKCLPPISRTKRRKA